MSAPPPTPTSVRPIVGLETHVELATRRKNFSSSASPAFDPDVEHPPNSLLDPLVLGLPGALPVLNRAAVEMSILVGLALGCSIAPRARWDRKNYFYPDMPKAYQISQYDLPLCFDGAFDLPAPDASGLPDLDAPARRIGIIRAHLEEDAGKLLHEAPGGAPIDHSILDLNRAGAPLLEIVTAPDFTSADEVVLFARLLRAACRALRVTHGVMQKGHIRFEPNINCELTFPDGQTLRTPIVEVKNLNSFRALRGAIEHELAEQPRRWLEDRRVMGPGAKTTRGWDDTHRRTFPQRDKEDAHDYRYFPDPDIPPLDIDPDWTRALRDRLPERVLARHRRFVREAGLPPKEAFALAEEPDVCEFYERVVDQLVLEGLDRPRAGKLAGNWVLGLASRRANELAIDLHRLGITPAALARLARLRDEGRLSNQGAETLFDALRDPANTDSDPEALAQRLSLLIVHDARALDAWVRAAIALHPRVAQDVRAGKVAAVGRLVGEVMKQAGGNADAKAAREAILKALADEG